VLEQANVRLTLAADLTSVQYFDREEEDGYSDIYPTQRPLYLWRSSGSSSARRSSKSFPPQRRLPLTFQRHSNPVLISLARRLNRDPTILLVGLFAILTSILLLNPEGVAPGVSNILAFLPAIATLRHIDSSASLAKAEQGKFLLDYWVCVGTSFVLEQVFSNEVVGGLIPVWWLVKGIAGVAVWMSLVSAGKAGRATAPRGLTLVSWASLA
jgi:hypothetical protein